MNRVVQKYGPIVINFVEAHWGSIIGVVVALIVGNLLGRL